MQISPINLSKDSFPPFYLKTRTPSLNTVFYTLKKDTEESLEGRLNSY